MKKHALSVCLIIKNEEHNIEKCLLSILPHVKEVILVDTGSTDQTLKVASKFPVRIEKFSWTESFSDARNYALQFATQPWILTMDADEEIVSESISNISEILDNPVNSLKAGRVIIMNLLDENEVSSTRITRIFPNRSEFRYQGRIHEQVKYNGESPETFNLPLIIRHAGYMKSSVLKKKKTERNLKLLFEEIKKDPDNPYLQYQIAKTYYVQGQNNQAIPIFQKVLNDHPHEKSGFYTGCLLALCHALLKENHIDLLMDTLKKGLEIYPDYTDLYFIYAIALTKSLDPKFIQDIPKVYMHCIALGEADPSKYETVEGVGSYKAHYNLGIYFELTGNKEQAVQHYKASIVDQFKLGQKRLEGIL